MNNDFYSGRIRTLVAMATYIFHRLIMVKVKIDIFPSQVGYLEFILQTCLLCNSEFHTAFGQIAEFDLLPE